MCRVCFASYELLVSYNSLGKYLSFLIETFWIWIWIWIVYADRTSDWYRVSGTGGAQANPYLGSF